MTIVMGVAHRHRSHNKYAALVANLRTMTAALVA
jgi:hypothetical protein